MHGAALGGDGQPASRVIEAASTFAGVGHSGHGDHAMYLQCEADEAEDGL
jgi:hypothetical protein